MIRRALYVLALLALAVPAGASVLFVDEVINPGNGNALEASVARMAIQGYATRHGVEWGSIPSSAATNAGVRAANYTANGETRQYDVVMHTNFSTDNSPHNFSVYDPRTLTTTSGWPSKVHVFFFEPYLCSFNGDTTGATGCDPNSVFFGSLYSTRGPYVWKSPASLPHAALLRATRPPGIFRTIVGYRSTPCSSPVSNNNALLKTYKDCDSLSRKTEATEDSAMIWVRQRSAGDPGTLIFVMLGNYGKFPNMGLIDIAFALADSFSGGKVFENRGKTTQKHALMVVGGNQQGDPRSTSTMQHNGVYCPSGSESADTCDMTNLRAGADSLRRLTIPVSIGIDPESTTTTRGASLIAMWKQNSLAKFLLQPMSGAYNNSTTRASAAGRCIDPFGIIRRRTLWPDQSTPSLTPSCASDSGSLFCAIKSGFATLDAMAPGRVVRAVAPCGWDWTPQEWTTAGQGTVTSGNLVGGEDSLSTALWAAGAQVVLQDPTLAKAVVGLVNSAGGATGAATAPAGWNPVEHVKPAIWNDVVVGGTTFRNVRWEPQLPWSYVDGHPVGEEWAFGATAGIYYPLQLLNWNHVFDVSTSVFALPANSFGGPWGNPWPQFNGYRAIKWLVHAQRAAEQYLPAWPDGTPKKLHEWVYVDQLGDPLP